MMNNKKEQSQIKRPDLTPEMLDKWQKITNLVAEQLNVPAGLIMKVEPNEITVFKSSESAGNPYKAGERANLNTGLYCETVMGTREMLLVPDALASEKWKRNPDIELGMISYLGFPICWPDEGIFGTICALDNKFNRYNARYRNLLNLFRDILESDLRGLVESEEEKNKIVAEYDKSRMALLSILEDAKMKAEALRESEKRLRLSTELGKVAVWEYNFKTDSMSRSINHDGLYGLEIQEKWEFGTFLNATHPDDREMSNGMIQKSVAPGGPDRYTFDFRVVYPDQSIHWLEVTGEVIERDAEGRGILVRGTLIDITKRKNTEEELVRSRSLLDETQQIGNVGGWEFDTVTMELIWTEEVFRIHELDLDWKPTVEQVINFYAPSSRPIIESAVQRAIEKGESYNVELELITAKGNHRWVRAVGQADLKQHRVYGFFQDITDRKKAEESQRKSESQFRVAFEFSGLGMCLTGLDGKLIRVNDSLCRMLGYSRAELEGQHFNSISYPDDQKIGNETVRKLISGEANTAVFEKRYLSKSGSPIWVHINTAMVHDEAGKPVHFITQIDDVTDIKQTHEKLRRSEEQFSKAFHAGPTGMTITRIKDGKFIDVNDSFLSMFEFSRDEVIGHTSTELNMWTPEERKRLIEKQIETGGLRNFELKALTKTGKAINILFSSKTIKIESDDCLLTTMIDITVSKKAVENLRLSEEKFSQAFKSSPAALLLTRLKDGCFLEVNETYCKLVGYESDTLIGHFTTEFNIFINPTDRQTIVKQLLEKKSVRNFETSIRHKSGDIRHIIASQELIIAKGEECILSSMVDITERKRAEEALFESEERNRLVLENSLDAILLTRPDGTILSANRAACEMFDRTEEEICGLGRTALVDLEDPRLPILIKERERAGKVKGELTMLRKDGSKFPVEMSSSIFIDRDGGKKTSMIIRDITERKLADAAIQKRDALLNLTGQMAKVGGWEFDPQTGAGTWTSEVAKIHDLAPDADTSKAIGLSFYHGKSRELIESAIKEATENGKSYDLELEMITAKGNHKWVRTIGQPVIEGGRLVKMQGSFQDITDRKRAEQEIHMRAEELAVLNTLGHAVSKSLSLDSVVAASLEHALHATQPDLVFIFLLDGEKLNLAGFSPKQAGSIVGKFPPHQVGHCLCGLAVKQGQALYSKDIFQDGRCSWVDCKEAGLRSFAAIPLVSGENVIGVLGLACESERDFEKDSEFLETFASQVAGGIRNAQLYSEIQTYAATLEDQVDKRTAQLKNANEGLESFAYSVSHDLRAPLRAMSGFSKALIEDYADQLDDQGRNFLQRIVGASHQMETLIQDLLTYSRIARSEIDMTPVDLNQVIREIRERLNADVAVPKELPSVVGSRTLVSQVFENLVSNAIKFVSVGTKPKIRISAGIENGRVTIRVKDNGIGIDPEYHERIFNVFERLHGVEAYPGTGIGLAIVKKGIEKLGGRICLESAVGKGSTFIVELKTADSVKS